MRGAATGLVIAAAKVLFLVLGRQILTANAAASGATSGRFHATFLLKPCVKSRRRVRRKRTLLDMMSSSPTERTVVLAYYKPANIITSHSNADAAPQDATTSHRRTVYQDIESMQGFVGHSGGDCFSTVTGIRSKWHAVGRLDADTTGLLLLTNDGGLVHHVTNPTSSLSLSKTYEAVIMGHWDDDQLDVLRTEGVDIGKKYGGLTNPCDALKILDYPTHKSTFVSITISEGKNRQVRRMFHAIQSGVMKLKRVRIGELLTLDGLEEGQWRILSDEEIMTGLQWEPQPLLTNENSSTKIDNRGRSKRKTRKKTSTTNESRTPKRSRSRR